MNDKMAVIMTFWSVSAVLNYGLCKGAWLSFKEQYDKWFLGMHKKDTEKYSPDRNTVRFRIWDEFVLIAQSFFGPFALLGNIITDGAFGASFVNHPLQFCFRIPKQYRG